MTRAEDGSPIEPPYDSLPEHLAPGMRRYLEQGIRPGGFLYALLSNDLLGAVKRADPAVRFRLLELVDWLLEHAPAPAWGTPALVEAWIVVGGFNGYRGGKRA